MAYLNLWQLTFLIAAHEKDPSRTRGRIHSTAGLVGHLHTHIQVIRPEVGPAGPEAGHAHEWDLPRGPDRERELGPGQVIRPLGPGHAPTPEALHTAGAHGREAEAGPLNPLDQISLFRFSNEFLFFVFSCPTWPFVVITNCSVNEKFENKWRKWILNFNFQYTFTESKLEHCN